jgi:hypothetical protein
LQSNPNIDTVVPGGIGLGAEGVAAFVSGGAKADDSGRFQNRHRRHGFAV